MALLQALLAAIAHSSGRVANLAFSWATAMLFGRVPDDRQILLSAICMISFAWLICLFGLAFPIVATYLLTFAAPKWLDENVVRMVMLGLVLLGPAVTGVLSIFLQKLDKFPSGKELLNTVAKGYPLTVGLSFTLVVLLVFAPTIKIVDLVKKWQTTHVAVQIMPEDYLAIVDAVQKAVQSRGFKAQRTPSSAMMRWPLRVLMSMSGSTFKSFISDNLTTLKLEDGEIAIYPADIVIRASKHASGTLQAAITEELTFTPANLTWTDEAQHLESMIELIYERNRRGQLSKEDAKRHLEWLDKSLASMGLDFKEWQTVFMLKLLLEREILTSELKAAERANRRRSA